MATRRSPQVRVVQGAVQPCSEREAEQGATGFQYAISITDPRVLAIFVGATLLAVAIAWFTTAGYAFRVARANPGRALRTE